MNSHEALRDQLNIVRDIFQDDLDLVRKDAARHNKGFHVSSMLNNEAPNRNVYDLRVPAGTNYEVDAIENAKIVVLACIDPRQATDVFEKLNPDVFITVAGGPTQPDGERLAALTELFVKIYEVNPNAKLIAVAHNEICRGVNHFTNNALNDIRPEMKKTKYSSESVEAYFNRQKENKYLIPLLDQFFQGVFQGGVEAKNIIMKIAEVRGDQFRGLISLHHRESPSGPLEISSYK